MPFPTHLLAHTLLISTPAMQGQSLTLAIQSWPLLSQVIVEKVSGSQIVDIDKRKYLVPSDITVAQFMWIIRKRIQLPSEKAIFLFVDKTVPQSRWGVFTGIGHLLGCLQNSRLWESENSLEILIRNLNFVLPDIRSSRKTRKGCNGCVCTLG